MLSLSNKKEIQVEKKARKIVKANPNLLHGNNVALRLSFRVRPKSQNLKMSDANFRGKFFSSNRQAEAAATSGTLF